jgi:hypothetical protein
METLTPLEESAPPKATLELVEPPSWTDAWKLGGLQPFLMRKAAADPREPEAIWPSAHPTSARTSNLLSNSLLFPPSNLRTLRTRLAFRLRLLRLVLELNERGEGIDATALFQWLLHNHRESREGRHFDHDLDYEEYGRLALIRHAIRETHWKTAFRDSGEYVREFFSYFWFGGGLPRTVRLQLSGVSGRTDPETSKRCTEHWLTFCPKEACALCQHDRRAEQPHTPKVQQVKHRTVLLYVIANGKPDFSEKAPEILAVYPSKLERVAIADYANENSALGRSLNFTPRLRNPKYLKSRDGYERVAPDYRYIARNGEDLPQYWVGGDGYEAIEVETKFYDKSHFQILQVPRGSIHVPHGKDGSEKVWQYPERFLEPHGGRLGTKDLWTELEQIAGIASFDIQKTDYRNPSDVENLSYALSDYSNRMVRVENGVLEIKKPSDKKWRKVRDRNLLALPTLSNSTEPFQQHAFSHLAADDVLGGGLVSAKSQSARYNFRNLETDIYPTIFAGQPLEIEPSELNVVPYHETSETPLSEKLCNHEAPGAADYCTICTPKAFPLHCAGRHFTENEDFAYATAHLGHGCEVCPKDHTGKSILEPPTKEELARWNRLANLAVGGKLCECGGLLMAGYSQDEFICDECGFSKVKTEGSAEETEKAAEEEIDEEPIQQSREEPIR